jgi:heme exporter protein CcmD
MSMLDLPHIGFVIAAYATGLIVVAWLIGSVLWDHAALRRALAAYEMKGMLPPGSEDAPQ